MKTQLSVGAFGRIGMVVLAAGLCGACVSSRRCPSPHLVAKIADCDRYAALNPRFAKAFAFLKRSDLADLKPGRYEIDGDDCWAMVQEAKLTSLEAVPTVEMHRRYIDIQAPITGPETFGFLTATDEQLTLPFDEAKDYVLFKAATERTATLQPGEFVVFFPPDGAHAPCHAEDAPRTIRKLVIKVRAE